MCGHLKCAEGSECKKEIACTSQVVEKDMRLGNRLITDKDNWIKLHIQLKDFSTWLCQSKLTVN